MTLHDNRASLQRSREAIYCAALMLAMFCFIADTSVLPYMLGEAVSDMILKILRYLSYALVVCSIVLRPGYSVRTIASVALVMLLAALNARHVGNTLMLTLLFAVGMIGMDYHRVAKAQLALMTAMFLFIVIGSLAGLMENWGFDLTTKRPRYCLGFFYPSHTASLFFYGVLLFCFVMGSRLRLWHIGVIALMDLWQYTYTDARAGTVLALLAAVCVWLSRFGKAPGRVVRVLLPSAFVLCAAACLILTWAYQSGPVDLTALDNLLAKRLSMQQNALQSFSVRPFGQQITWIGHGGTGHTQLAAGERYNYVDSSYIKVLLDQGAVMWAVLLAGFTAASVRAVRRGEWALVIVLAFSAVYASVEQWWIHLGYDPFFILIGALFAPDADHLPRIRFRKETRP